jgi:hypothetical protein
MKSTGMFMADEGLTTVVVMHVTGMMDQKRFKHTYMSAPERMTVMAWKLQSE